jgi:hypothetical protein
MTIQRSRHQSKARRNSRPTNRAAGYGKPPPAHQFKPGQSGNPKGRPKGTKNESTLLRELLHRKIEVREGGHTRKLTVLEAIHLRIAEDSLKGNTKSAAFLLNRYGALVSGETAPTTISEDDEQIVQDFVRKLQQKPTK